MLYLLGTLTGDSLNEYKQIREHLGTSKADLSLESINADKKSQPRALYYRLLHAASLITVEPISFFYACALILHAPMIQQYVYFRINEQRGLDVKFDNEVSSCRKTDLDAINLELRKDVQSLTSYIHMGIILAASVPSLFTALILGNWSDKVGRKVILLLPVVGGLVDASLILVTMYVQLPLYVLFIGSFFNGLCGFFTTMILAVFSYIADISPESERALRLGILEAVAFVSGMISHLTSGWWIRHLGFKAPYWFILSLHFMSLLYIVLVLPESRKRTDKKRLKDLFDSSHLLRIFVIFRNAGSGTKRLLCGLTVTSALMMISSIGFGGVIVLYALDMPFCFSPIMIGYFLACSMLAQAIGAVFALFILQRCLSEIMLALIGFLSIISSLIMISFVRTKWLMFLVPVVGSFGGVCMPIIRAKMSKLVRQDEQGALFAAVATLETLCTLLGAAIFNSLYSYSVKYLNYRGFSFLVMASMTVVPCIILSWVGTIEAAVSKAQAEAILSTASLEEAYYAEPSSTNQIAENKDRSSCVDCENIHD